MFLCLFVAKVGFGTGLGTKTPELRSETFGRVVLFILKILFFDLFVAFDVVSKIDSLLPHSQPPSPLEAHNRKQKKAHYVPKQ